MIMIYYWDKLNGCHLENVMQKIHPLNKTQQINVVFF